MRSGEASVPIVVRRHVETRDPVYNEVTRAWADHASMWARVYPLRGGEQYDAGQREAVSRYAAIVDYLDGQTIVETDQIVLEGVTFEIESVLKDFATKKSVTLRLRLHDNLETS